MILNRVPILIVSSLTIAGCGSFYVSNNEPASIKNKGLSTELCFDEFDELEVTIAQCRELISALPEESAEVENIFLNTLQEKLEYYKYKYRNGTPEERAASYKTVVVLNDFSDSYISMLKESQNQGMDLTGKTPLD